MWQIMRYDKSLEKWVPVSESYSGLNDKDKDDALKTLRRYAREDNSGEKYKAREVVIVPR